MQPVPARMLLADATLLDPEAAAPARGSLLVEGGRIAARLAADARGPEDAERIALGGALLGPGLVDVHHHGDLVLRPAAEARASLEAASAALLAHGVTAFLPTTLAWPAPELAARVEAMAAAVAGGAWPGAVPLGLHLEGPWIRHEAAGAQPEAGIRPYDADEATVLFNAAAGLVRLVTLAPELPRSDALLAALARRGIAAAIGHTLASPEELGHAVDAGARHATHLFNAMGPLHQRGPGVAASLLADDRLSCDVIADGAHVHPDWLRVAARVKGERLVLITDRIDPPPGAVDGGWPGGARVTSDGVAWRLPDGRLAGSHVALHDAIRRCVSERVMTQLAAVRAASVMPARLLGVEAAHGTLRPGARADLVRWRADGEPAAVWVEGRLVYAAE